MVWVWIILVAPSLCSFSLSFSLKYCFRTNLQMAEQKERWQMRVIGVRSSNVINMEIGTNLAAIAANAKFCTVFLCVFLVISNNTWWWHLLYVTCETFWTLEKCGLSQYKRTNTKIAPKTGKCFAPSDQFKCVFYFAIPSISFYGTLSSNRMKPPNNCFPRSQIRRLRWRFSAKTTCNQNCRTEQQNIPNASKTNIMWCQCLKTTPKKRSNSSMVEQQERKPISMILHCMCPSIPWTKLVGWLYGRECHYSASSLHLPHFILRVLTLSLSTTFSVAVWKEHQYGPNIADGH